ncbi:MAG TPA: DUF58 domain-containing protein [Chloroflexi bacterium]|nr:DUF58 domain-containing protein [Chloroflexota bacterium]
MIASRHVVLVLLGLSLLALAVTGFPIYARLSYLWALLVVSSWIWSKLSLRGMQVSRQARLRRAQMGEIFQEQFEVKNDSHFPHVLIEVHDQASLPGTQGSRVLTWLGRRQQRTYLARTRLVQRGEFSLGPTVLAAGDPFGLFPVSRTVPTTGTVLVYPIMVDIHAFPNPPGLLPGGEALRRLTHQVTPNAAGVREYAPGDSMNRIHWPSTARRERLIVKEFELDPLADVWIFVDGARRVQSQLPHSPSDIAVDALWHPMVEVTVPPSTEEYAATVAASLGRYFLQRGRAVGLVSCGQHRSPTVLPPDRGARQLGKILEAMALLRAEGELSISALVSAQAQHLPRGSTVVLITPSIEEEVGLTVDHLVRLGLRPVAVLLDAASFSGPPGTKALATTIASLGVPVRRVENGADIGMALSLDFSGAGGNLQ